MVQFTFRSAPAMQKAAEIVQSGELGELRHVEASYLQGWLTSERMKDIEKYPALG